MEYFLLNKVACYSNSFEAPMVQYVSDEELQTLVDATMKTNLPIAIYVNGKRLTGGTLNEATLQKIEQKIHYEVN